MKKTLLFASLSALLSSSTPVFAAGPAPTVPEALKEEFEALKASYPRLDGRRGPKAPADSAWVFRSEVLGSGTVEVAFQGDEVVYMVFRRGIGGAEWKPAEIATLHFNFHQTLLKEQHLGGESFSKYRHFLAPRINSAIITRKDFDGSVLMKGI